MGVKPQQTDRLPALEFSQVLSEKGLVLKNFTKLTARGLSVPAAKPALLIKNDSKIMFKVRHGQRLGGLPEEGAEDDPGGSQPETREDDQDRAKETRSRRRGGAEPEEEDCGAGQRCEQLTLPSACWERRQKDQPRGSGDRERRSCRSSEAVGVSNPGNLSFTQQRARYWRLI